MPFATTWMDLEIIILSEVSQTEKDKHYMISLICVILENDTNETYLQNRKRLTRKKKIMVTKWEGERRDKLGVWG